MSAKSLSYPLPSLSVVFPAYNDMYSIPLLIEKILLILPNLTADFEIIVVNDGSQDQTKRILNRLAKQTANLEIIHHQKNLGYGAALMSGFRAATKEFIFYTDGDGQYDVLELPQLIKALTTKTDMVTGFKVKRSDSWVRKMVGNSYRQMQRMIFHFPISDVNCDFRLFRREILNNLKLTITSGAFGAEFIGKLHQHRAHFKEVPVHHYPRQFGHSQFFTPKKLAESFRDLCKLAMDQYRSPH